MPEAVETATNPDEPARSDVVRLEVPPVAAASGLRRGEEAALLGRRFEEAEVIRAALDRVIHIVSYTEQLHDALRPPPSRGGVNPGNETLPHDRSAPVRYGQIIVALAGYQNDFLAAIFSLIADAIFAARVSNELPLPALFVLEEAHTFAPAKADTLADQQAVATTRQIAQEGRKFGVGLVLISQRPSRLDETTLSQCNSSITMRMANPADQSYVRRVIETLGEDEAQMLPDLDVGEAILSGQLVNFPVLVRIKPPESTGDHEEEDAFVSLEKARQAAASVSR